MLAWTVWCSCAVLQVSLQRVHAERFKGGNNLLDDYYDDDLDGWGTTDVNWPPPGTGDNNNSNQTETYAWTDDYSPKPGTDAGTDDNSNGSGMDIPIDNNVTRPETDFTTDKKVTRPDTGFPTDKRVTRPDTGLPTDKNETVTGFLTVNTTTTRPETDVATGLRGRTTTSVDARPTATGTTRFPDDDALPDVTCRNSSSCPKISSLTTSVEEGRNVTLRCGTASGSTATFRWYRNATLLQRGVGEVVLHLPDVDRSQSGHYLCADERNCCVLVHRVSVYGVPRYVYHLAVMGAVLVLGIFLCVFLTVRQSSTLGRYARMFNERHGEEKLLVF